MRILTVVGARPQFIKAATLGRALARHGIEECSVHTGQHYDEEMSGVFYRQLAMAPPAYALDVGSAPHGAQTGEMMRRLEPIVVREAPDWVLVYGDTNSTLAGALVGAKCGAAVAHVEAGLRSFNRAMPEELNRIVADHVADVHFAPNEQARIQLEREGISGNVHVVGDLMIDLAREALTLLPPRPDVLDRFALASKGFALVTIHRAANTDDPQAFRRIVEGLRRLPMRVIFPAHPRTRTLTTACGVGDGDNIMLCEPLPYLEMLALQRHARSILTDSGGVQKEALVVGTPCTTLREETEWDETLDYGWNVLVGTDPAAIVRAGVRQPPTIPPSGIFGETLGCAERIATVLARPAAARSRSAPRAGAVPPSR
ncbi:UDP-N-acetylglucosamine 2-epimerase (non-hydrolyzing) [bacterium]|nr:MAG: UDP-N-acetylglucosamine 2-epimerase (non-hydrolyzing) [bacterium]